MNDKDKEAFEKWFKDAWDIDFDAYDFRHTIQVKAWQAACEYKDKEINDDEELLRDHMNSIGYRELKKLQAENKKLREALDNAHDDFTKQGLHKQASRVLLALNITTTREALKKVEDE
jgi:hypothetical protein